MFLKYCFLDEFTSPRMPSGANKLRTCNCWRATETIPVAFVHVYACSSVIHKLKQMKVLRIAYWINYHTSLKTHLTFTFLNCKQVFNNNC